MTRGAAERLVLSIVITAAVLAGGLTKIADLDFWWHLKTGELIVQERAIPATDVFSFTAAGREYIDHEWLFQVVQILTWNAGGAAAIAVLKCLLVAFTLILVALYAMRRGADVWVAGGLTLLAFGAGITRFIERPELFSTLFAVVTFIVLESYVRDRDRRQLFVLPLLCALWANVHAAVIVGLVIQVIFIGEAILRRAADRLPLLTTLAGSLAASLLNPFTYRVLTVPFELTRIINSGVLNNEEWRHPSPMKVPFYFVALAICIALLIRSLLRREDAPRLAHVGVALFLGYISLRYIRNVALFAVFVPLVTDARQLGRAWRTVIVAAGTFAAVVILTVYFPFQRGFGVASYFPDRIASYARRANLGGHMMNSYSFGGYLIWSLFPERRVFVDGRNEVYLPLLERLKAARSDSRAWTALLREYRIEYALMDYVDELDRVTIIDEAGRARTDLAPITATRFPRSRWALTYFDDDGMVFVRRNGANAILDDYDAVFPEGRGYQRALVARGTVDRARAIEQLRRKIALDPSCRRAAGLLRSLGQNP